MKLFVPVAALVTLLANGAAARDYCPDRPGLDTPPQVFRGRFVRNPSPMSNFGRVGSYL